MWAANPDRRRGPGFVPCPRPSLCSDQRGISLVELVVAMAVLGIIVGGLALSLSVDYKAIALARSRGVAEAAASKRLEEFRDVDYHALSLLTQPTKSSDPTNPDSFVSADGAQYDVTGTGQNEDLIVTLNTGTVTHTESNLTVGTTVMDIYRYVTWVDIASVSGIHDLKRLSVVVRYRATPGGGTTRVLRESVLLTPGTVSVGASAVTTTTTTTTTTTLPPTTTTTLAGTTCGSFTIAGASPATSGFTATTATTITMSLGSCGSNVLVNFSNNGGQTWGPDFSYGTIKTTAWTLTTGDGKKTVSAKIRNGAAGSPKSLALKTIILDTTLPTKPISFTRTATCSSSNRTVVLTWSPSIDANLVGYRVYRNTGSGFSLLSTTATTTASNTHAKSLASVSFYVTAYDSAGNVSIATSTIILTQNQCS